MGSGGALENEGVEPAEKVAVTMAVVPVGIPEEIDWSGGMPSPEGAGGRVEGIEMVVTVAAAEPVPETADAVAEPEDDGADDADDAADVDDAELEAAADAAEDAWRA